MIRIASVINDSIVDGKGIRYTIFTQGCKHNCEGCHNPSTHDVNGGKDVSIQSIIDEIKENPLLDGITLSGGEPFLQPLSCQKIAQATHQLGLDVYCYTGYTLEALLEIAKTDSNVKSLLNEIDVLIDGPFILKKRDLTLRFKGSSNQRIINMQKTREENKIILEDE